MRHKAQISRALGLFGAFAIPAAIIGASAGNGTSVSTLGAQQVAAADSCDSVFVWSRVGWVEQGYKGALRQWDPDIEFPQSHLVLTLNGLGAAIRFDGPVDFSTLAESGARDTISDDVMAVGGRGTFGVHGLYGFIYRSDGKLTDPRVLVSSLSDRVDSAIIRAVRVASDSGDLLPLPVSIGSVVEMRLTLGTRMRDDSLAESGTLFRVRQPVFDQMTEPEGDSMRISPPRYPSEALREGIEGGVEVEVVIRSDGSIDPRSVLIPRATHGSFARQVLDVLLKSRFKPARVGGCPVSSIHSLPFAFTIQR